MHQAFPLYSTTTLASDRQRYVASAAKPTATIPIIAVEKPSMGGRRCEFRTTKMNMQVVEVEG